MYKEIISPVLDKFDSETAHVAARELLNIAEVSPLTLKILEQFADQHQRFEDERLRVVVGGIELENPLIVGAGWDKKGKAVKALWQLGFAGIEVGSVLAYDQPGNKPPREFIIGPGVSLNRMGFNSPGMERVAKNLERYANDRIPIGISVGKNKEYKKEEELSIPQAHAVVVERLYGYATYFVINVSSPNTPGLRTLQDKEPLTDIVQAVNQTMEQMGGRKPLFVKIAPELTDTAVDDVIEVVIDNGLAGIIAVNTTTNETLKAKYGKVHEAGGLAGDDPDYRRMATEKIRHIYSQVGDKIDIIGVGGIKDANTALEKIKAGARAIQIVTAIRGEGTAVAGRINRGLVDFMEREGINSIKDLVGGEVI